MNKPVPNINGDAKKVSLSRMITFSPNQIYNYRIFGENQYYGSITRDVYDILKIRGEFVFSRFLEFYRDICEYVNTVNERITNNNSSERHRPLFFTSAQYQFWATVEIDDETLLLSFKSMKLHVAYDDENSISARQTFSNHTGKDKTTGYDVIRMRYWAKDSFINYCHIDAAKHPSCHWCGAQLTYQQFRRGRQNDYCLGELKNGKISISDCKIQADAFLRQFKKIMDEWKQYRHCIMAGDNDKANEIKANSNYAYLLDDSERFDYVTHSHPGVRLRDIKQILRPFIDLDTFQPVNFDEKRYNKGDIGPCCPVCGKTIPETKRIHAKYCSDDCRFKDHNGMKYLREKTT